jgi:hypothetical protein
MIERVKRTALSLEASFKQRVIDLCQNARLRVGEVDCIRGPLVYLGDHYHAGKEIKTRDMMNAVIDDAATWTAAQHKASPLAYYFHPSPSGGFELKLNYHCEIDHILPKNLAGLDHPGNYAFISQRLNASFQDKYEEKFQMMGRSVTNKVRKLHLDNKKATSMATATFLASLPKPASAKLIA